MKSKYLTIVWSALLIRYAAIYIPFAAIMAFSMRWSPLLPFTLVFWSACCILIVVEKAGSYTEFDDVNIVQRYFFLTLSVPIVNVVSVRNGHADSIIGQPKSIDMLFKRKDGSEGVRHILQHQFAKEDVRRFLHELLNRNRSIKIDHELLD